MSMLYTDIKNETAALSMQMKEDKDVEYSMRGNRTVLMIQ